MTAAATTTSSSIQLYDFLGSSSVVINANNYNNTSAATTPVNKPLKLLQVELNQCSAATDSTNSAATAHNPNPATRYSNSNGPAAPDYITNNGVKLQLLCSSDDSNNSNVGYCTSSSVHDLINVNYDGVDCTLSLAPSTPVSDAASAPNFSHRKPRRLSPSPPLQYNSPSKRTRHGEVTTLNMQEISVSDDGGCNLYQFIGNCKDEANQEMPGLRSPAANYTSQLLNDRPVNVISNANSITASSSSTQQSTDGQWNYITNERQHLYEIDQSAKFNHHTAGSALQSNRQLYTNLNVDEKPELRVMYSQHSTMLSTRSCAQCKTRKTPLWRNGPQGPKSLCNACGIRYKKEERRTSAGKISNHVPILSGHHVDSNLYINSSGSCTSQSFKMMSSGFCNSSTIFAGDHEAGFSANPAAAMATSKFINHHVDPSTDHHIHHMTSNYLILHPGLAAGRLY